MEQELGYLKGKVEGLERKVDEHINWEEKYHKDFDAKLDGIHDIIKEHLVVYRLFKTVVYTIGFILAFKFGDIREMWHHIWSNRL